MSIVLIQSRKDRSWRDGRTRRLIEADLRCRWRDVHSIRAANESELYARLHATDSHDGTFVFNTMEYLDEKRKRGFIPGLLDAWGIPHLGSPAITVLTGLDKGMTKAILTREGVPTPRYFVTIPDDAEMREHAARIGYPLIVKPLYGAGRAGIGEDCIARDPGHLERAVRHVYGAHGQPALVEKYIDGDGMREFTVGVIGARSRIHMPIEIDWAGMNGRIRILSAETPQQDLEKVRPVESPEIAEALNDLADRTFDAVGAVDFARIDIRTGGKRLYVLEINVMPRLGPQNYLSLAARDLFGFDHGDLIRLIARESIERQGLSSVA